MTDPFASNNLMLSPEANRAVEDARRRRQPNHLNIKKYNPVKVLVLLE